MKKISLLVACLGLVIAIGACSSETETENPAAMNAKLVVYKSPTCGCCGKWIEHLEEAGFEVETHNSQDMMAVKAEHGVEGRLSSCHTALIDGYVIEGHVPADQIKRLLADKPTDVLGLTVPGMPLGSPGMEMDDESLHTDYDVLTFDGQGGTAVFHHVVANSGS